MPIYVFNVLYLDDVVSMGEDREVAKRRRAQLVTQHLENISRGALEKYQDTMRQFSRGRYGVYALYKGNRIYYVGLARNLRSRLKQHLKDRHGTAWDRFSIYLTIGDQHLRELESLILRISKPTGNKVRGKFVKSEDLRRPFRRAIRHMMNEELISLTASVWPAIAVKKAQRADEKRRPVLAKFITRGFKLRARYKGTNVNATVRKSGGIRFDGKLFNSPSLAAKAVCHGKSVNGWWFWRYERSPGDWVQLRNLRKEPR